MKTAKSVICGAGRGVELIDSFVKMEKCSDGVMQVVETEGHTEESDEVMTKSIGATLYVTVVRCHHHF